jgi:hypothetical protein
MKNQRGFSLVGLLVSLATYVLFIGGAIALVVAFAPARDTTVNVIETTTHYTVRINGRTVECVRREHHASGTTTHSC